METVTKISTLVLRMQTEHKHFRKVFSEYYKGLSRAEKVLFAHTLDDRNLPYMDTEEQFYAFIRWMTGKGDLHVHSEVIQFTDQGNEKIESLARVAMKHVRKHIFKAK